MSARTAGWISMGFALVVASSANAALVTVSPGQALLLTETSSGANNSGNPATHDTSDISGIAGPASFTYANGFTSSQVGLPFFSNSSGSWGFYDDFVFTVGANELNLITSTITLGPGAGINDLQVRLYDYNANGGVAPLTSAPAPGSVLQAWSTSFSYSPGVTQTVSVLNPPAPLAAGTYVIEVRGTAVGTGGGSYSGVLNVTPVPLPAAAWLLLSGLGGLGLIRKRRATV